MDYITLAFTMGLMGAGHCLAMCGGIVGVLSSAISQKSALERFVTLFLYNLGRLTSYTFIGLIFGGLVQWFAYHVEVPLILIVLRILSGILIV